VEKFIVAGEICNACGVLELPSNAAQPLRAAIIATKSAETFQFPQLLPPHAPFLFPLDAPIVAIRAPLGSVGQTKAPQRLGNTGEVFN
jgi:hypothetical protein